MSQAPVSPVNVSRRRGLVGAALAAVAAPLVSTPHLAVLARQYGSQTALMAYNNSGQAQTVTIDLPAALRGKRGELWWGSGVVERQGQRMTLTVPPMGGWVWGTR